MRVLLLHCTGLPWLSTGCSRYYWVSRAHRLNTGPSSPVQMPVIGCPNCLYLDIIIIMAATGLAFKSASQARGIIKHKTIVVTGGSRGIGLGLVRRFLERDNKVIATARQVKDAQLLQQLASEFNGALQLTSLDTSEVTSIKDWAAGLKSSGLQHVDVLINNAGINVPSLELHQHTPEDFLNTFKTNAMGPFFVTKELYDQGLLGGAQPSVVVNMSSVMSSQTEETISNKLGGRYAYRSSKAALNAINKGLSMDLGPQGVQCVLMHPGYVKTDMTKGAGWIDVETSSNGILSVLEGDQPLNGRFYAYDGQEVPW